MSKQPVEIQGAPSEAGTHAGLGLLPLSPHDHPEPQAMVWSELEMQAIRNYAAACVAAEHERLCAAIKAADDKASEGDYMLDSDDCISVIRGTWNPGA